MSLLNFTNEIVNFVAHVVTFIFPIGIAIYVFRFKDMKDSLEKYKKLKIEKVVRGQQERISKKINKLFISGVATIFYAIFVKIVIFQFINHLNPYVLWLMLISAIILLVFTFYFLRSILLEIGLTDR